MEHTSIISFHGGIICHYTVISCLHSNIFLLDVWVVYSPWTMLLQTFVYTSVWICSCLSWVRQVTTLRLELLWRGIDTAGFSEKLLDCFVLLALVTGFRFLHILSNTFYCLLLLLNSNVQIPRQWGPSRTTATTEKSEGEGITRDSARQSLGVVAATTQPRKLLFVLRLDLIM